MDKAELLLIIEMAFGRVTLCDGIGLYEAEAIDNYASDKERLKARKKDRESWKRWDEIPTEIIETFYSALCFVDIEGMRFLLPAYMKFAVNYFKNSDSASVDSPIHALQSNPVFAETDIDDYFTEEQYEVFAKFLRFMILEAGFDSVDSDGASQAYENHWVKYDSYMA